MGRMGLIIAVIAWGVFIIRLVVTLSRSLRRAPAGGPRYQAPSPPHNGTARSPYQILEIPPGASAQEVTAAYRRLVQMYHPDKVANMAPEFRKLAEERIKEINAAYQELK